MRVALLDDYQDVALASTDWSVLGPEYEVVPFHDHLADGDALVERLRDFDVAMAMRERTAFPRAVLERLPRLRLLVTAGMRNAAIDVAAARELGITVCGTGGRGYATAELTWGLILALARHIPEEHAAVLGGRWQTTVGMELRHKTLGIVGLGSLGTQVAKVGQAFGMDVIAWSQNLTAEHASERGVTRVEKDELFARADIVSVHVVLSDRTRGLIGAQELGLMQPTAYLVNTSRGPIVDERALIDALRSRQIAGAALDVYDVEPLPADHPFRGLDNLLMTPHIGYVTGDTYQLWYRDALEDIQSFAAGNPIRVVER
ncbi:MAG: D-2-hydroxyacid dehydrogenase family protein [Dehalococcoidia bacterium]|nr:D-2-hydroxyacid dehydrogenase family protein [Dehalococcoidia bacterium]